MRIEEIKDSEGLRECLECDLGKLTEANKNIPNPDWVSVPESPIVFIPLC